MEELFSDRLTIAVEVYLLSILLTMEAIWGLKRALSRIEHVQELSSWNCDLLPLTLTQHDRVNVMEVVAYFPATAINSVRFAGIVLSTTTSAIGLVEVAAYVGL